MPDVGRHDAHRFADEHLDVRNELLAGRRVKVRDLPLAGEAVTLVWANRIWRCPDRDCATKTRSEPSEEIALRAVLTERARAGAAGAHR